MFLQKFIKVDRTKALNSQNHLSRSYNVTNLQVKRKSQPSSQLRPSVPIDSKTHAVQRDKLKRYSTQPDENLLVSQTKSLDQVILNYIRSDTRKKMVKLRAKNITRNTQRSVDFSKLIITNSEKVKQLGTISQTKSQLFAKDKQRQQYSPYKDHQFFKSQEQQIKRKEKQRKSIFRNPMKVKGEDPTLLQIRKIDFQEKIENRRIFNSYKMLVTRQRIRNSNNISLQQFNNKKIRAPSKRHENYSIQPW